MGLMGRKLLRNAQWLRWLKPGLEVKRWLLLLALSILLLDLGVAYLLKAIYREAELPAESYWLTLQFWPHPVRAVIFGTVGVGLLVFSFVKLQRSVLGPFLPGGDRSIADLLSPSARGRAVPASSRSAAAPACPCSCAG
jgi:hypothetical protein